MKDIEGLQQTFNKQKTAVEKLLPEIALLKRKSKCWRTCTTSRCKIRWRIYTTVGERRAGNESAIVKLQTRLAAAEDELKGAARLDTLPEWIFQNR